MTTADIDGSDLMKVAVDYMRLTLVLKNIVGRVEKLETAPSSPPPPVAPAVSTPAVESPDALQMEARVKALEDALAELPRKPVTTVTDIAPAQPASIEAPRDVTAPPSYEPRLKALEDAVGDLRVDGGQTVGHLADLKNRVTAIEKDRDTAPQVTTPAAVSQTAPDSSAQLAQLESTVASLKRQVGDVESRAADTAAGLGDVASTLRDKVLPETAKVQEEVRNLQQRPVAIANEPQCTSDDRDKMEAAIADLAKQLSALATQVSTEVVPGIDRLQHQARSLEGIPARVDGLETQTKQTDDAVADVKQKLADLTARFANLSSLPDDLSALKAKMDAQEGLISMLQPQTGTDAAGGDALKGFMTTLTNVLEDLSKLKNAVDDLQRRAVASAAAQKGLQDAHDALEAAVKTHRTETDAGLQRHNSLIGDLATLKADRTDVETATTRIDDHDAKLAELLKAVAAAGDKRRDSPVVPAAVTTPAVAAATDRASQRDLDALRQDVTSLQAHVNDHKEQIDKRKSETTALAREATALAGQCQRLADEKASHDDLLAAIGNHGAQKAVKAVAPTPPADDSRQIKALRADVDTLKDRMDAMVQESKAAASNRLPASPTSEGLVPQAVHDQLAQVAQAALRDREWTQGQVVEIRATIEHIHHTKADAALVANKAERDYVENALEKLMREVEQVLNSTNAGLIDTLDKSLGILRDMIDGKASKGDVAKLKQSVAAGGDVDGGGGVGSVPDGLMGYRSYRCLGCNRTVEAMRPRPMGANFASFMNRLPASPHAGGGARPTTSQGSVPAITQ